MEDVGRLDPRLALALLASHKRGAKKRLFLGHLTDGPSERCLEALLQAAVDGQEEEALANVPPSQLSCVPLHWM